MLQMQQTAHQLASGMPSRVMLLKWCSAGSVEHKAAASMPRQLVRSRDLRSTRTAQQLHEAEQSSLYCRHAWHGMDCCCMRWQEAEGYTCSTVHTAGHCGCAANCGAYCQGFAPLGIARIASMPTSMPMKTLVPCLGAEALPLCPPSTHPPLC